MIYLIYIAIISFDMLQSTLFERKEEKFMGMTMTQKILAAHAGLDFVEPGQLIEADLDLVLGNDITAAK